VPQQRPPNKRKLTDQFINGVSSESRSIVWDTKLAGFAVAVYPTGKKVFKCIYPFAGRTRWFTVGRSDKIDLKDARQLAAKALLRVAGGEDPQALRRRSAAKAPSKNWRRSTSSTPRRRTRVGRLLIPGLPRSRDHAVKVRAGAP